MFQIVYRKIGLQVNRRWQLIVLLLTTVFLLPNAATRAAAEDIAEEPFHAANPFWKNIFNTSDLGGDVGPTTVINRFFSMLHWIAGVAAIIFFGYNLFLMITAAGDEEKIAKAKRGLIATLAGIVVYILTLVIIKASIQLSRGNI